MTSLPLDVHQVLEQEYEAIEGKPYEKPPITYRDRDVIDKALAAKICNECEIKGDPLEALSAINAIITTGDNLKNLKSSTQLGERWRTFIDGCDASTPPEVRRRIVDEAFGGAMRRFRDVSLDALYGELHKPENARSALCISGGGIRSATFALGVIQGLASAKILDQFQYLSSVSGGGYIGSWLSSWARRHPKGISGVQEDLAQADTASGEKKRARPSSKINPEPQPLRHLRDYSNYLSPKLGFLSADTWTMAALYVRNLMLNLLVLVPVLAGVLAVPRIFANLIRGDVLSVPALGVIAVAMLAIGFGYLGLARPVRHGRESDTSRFNTNSWFAGACVLPLSIAATAMTLYWAKASVHRELQADGRYWAKWAALAMTLVPCGVYYFRFFRTSFAERRQSAASGSNVRDFWKFATEFFGAVLGLATAFGLFWLIANKLFPLPYPDVPDVNAMKPLDRIGLGLPMGELYVCFAVPLTVLVFFVQASIFVGISSGFNEDGDREWWGRAGALLLMVAILGGGVFFISVFGPVLLYSAPILMGSTGAASGISAALLGYSAKTPANDSQKKEKGTGAAISGVLLKLVVPLFAIVLLAAISLGTTALINLVIYDVDTKAVTMQAQFVAKYSKTTPENGYERKDETAAMPAASVEAARSYLHLNRVHNTDRIELIFIGIICGAGLLLSFFIGANRFSMHGLYRNRLIRAYLGASRYTRDPDRFTGFDENDNLQMYELRPELLWPNSFDDPCAFVALLAKNHGSGVAKTIWDNLDNGLRKKIEKGKAPDRAVAAELIQVVNGLMQTIDLETGSKDGSPIELLKRNRERLEALGAKKLPDRRAPFHVVNTALNLVSGDNLAWQQRMAESFTISPLHCGSLYLGYRDARQYGGVDGISLGTAVTISGAAASPNMGYHSSVPMAFILTMLNVRLGSWLGNPGVAGDSTYQFANPRSNLESLFFELSGNTNDACPWVYLSDGGHFENLGLYEMVLRRCRFIVLTDGGCDPTFTFEDLGNAIRKIRTDLGVPIEIKKRDMFPRPKPGEPLKSGSYFAIATIGYSAIDKPQKEGETVEDGILIYFKPSVYDEDYLPRDVYNYAQQSETFPHETTADQFFSESQFESYRALGRHVVDVLYQGYERDESITTLAAHMRKSAGVISQPQGRLNIMEVTTTKGDGQPVQATGDTVRIRINPQP